MAWATANSKGLCSRSDARITAIFTLQKRTESKDITVLTQHPKTSKAERISLRFHLEHWGLTFSTWERAATFQWSAVYGQLTASVCGEDH